MRWHRMVVAATALAGLAPSARAQFTMTSPAGGTLPSGVSPVGGIVADLIGLNGARAVSQAAASSLFVGDSPSTPTFVIGTQTGFNSSILSALGGGLSKASFRVSLYDGDSQAGNFDFNQNFLRVNGAEVGNFSAVTTLETSSTGTPIGSTTLGFGNDILSTGFFSTADAGLLATIFAGMSSGSLLYELHDLTPGDQFYDFSQGIDQALLNVGQGPSVVTPPTTGVPEPSTVALLAGGLLALGGMARRRRSA